MNIEDIKKKIKDITPLLENKYGVSSIGVFGSYVKGEENKESDLDILVDFKESNNLSLLDFINMENYLSNLLKIKVDLVEKSSLKPRIGKYILKEVVNIAKV